MKVAALAIAAAVCGMLFGGNVRAQVTPAHVILTATAGGAPSTPESDFLATLNVRLQSGWYIYSLSQPAGGPLPTKIMLPGGQPFKLIGVILAPAPKREHSTAFDMDVEYYAGSVSFALPLRSTGAVPPDAEIAVEITYQACNGITCLLPKTDTVKARIAR